MNDDLISRQAAIDALIDALAWTWSGTWSEKAAIDAIKNLSSVDAVEVVRCKDCKYYNPEKNEYIWDSESCNHPLSDVSDPYEGYVLRVEPDDFCSRGERRTDG